MLVTVRRRAMNATRSRRPASSPPSAWIMLPAPWSARPMTASSASVTGSAGTVASPAKAAARITWSAISVSRWPWRSPRRPTCTPPAKATIPTPASASPTWPGDIPASRVRKIAEIAR